MDINFQTMTAEEWKALPQELKSVDAFQSLPANVKTEISGYKYLTDEEFKARIERSEEARSILLRFFLEELLTHPLNIGKSKTEEEMEESLTEPFNRLYQKAVELGCTYEELQEVEGAFVVITTQFQKIKNVYAKQLEKTTYKLLGENYYNAVPIKELIEKAN